jgi:NAD-dependent deacetylase
MDNALSDLTTALRSTHPGQILIVTGAGISLASGIPTFRGSDAGAIWKKDVTELGTHRFFLENPAGSWQWYLSRFAKVEGARPNPGHLALAALEQWQLARGGDFLLVTQNIDTLHEQAGSKRMVKVHGTSDRYRCDKYGCSNGPPKGSIPASEVDLTRFHESPTLAAVPRCPKCGGFLRMHVLWFDEMYTGHEDYQFHTVESSAEKDARLVVFIGTSFSVGVTALVLDGARMRGVPVFNIDPTPRVDEDEIRHVTMPSEVALVEVCRALGVTVPELAPAPAR